MLQASRGNWTGEVFVVAARTGHIQHLHCQQKLHHVVSFK
jgi:hypothetical protein